MKNIFELLEGIGLTVPEEQKTAFETAFGENYKAIADYNKAVKKRDEYKAALDEKPATTPENAAKLTDLEGQITALKDQLAAAGRDKAAREALTGKKFVNDITGKAILQGIIDALKADPGADPTEVLKSLTTDKDGKELPNVFVSEAEQRKARFTAPKNPASSSSESTFEKMPLSEKMAYANANPGDPDVVAWLKG